MTADWLDYLRPANLLSWPVFLVTLTWSLFIHFLDGANASMGHVGERFVMLLLLEAVMFGLLWVAGRAARGLSRIPMIIAMLSSIVVATLARGAMMAVILWWIGAVPQIELALRMSTSLVNIGSATILATVTTGQVRSHAETSSRLLAEQSRLRWLRAQAQDVVRRVDEELVQSITSQLQSMVAPIRGTLAAPALEILRAAIDEVVRPLSHRLSNQEQDWSPRTVEPRPLSINLRRIVLDAADPNYLRPVIVPAVLCVAIAPQLATQVGLDRTAVVLVYLAVAGWVTLWAARAIGTRVAGRWPVALRATYFFGLQALIGVILWNGMSALMSGTPFAQGYSRFAPISIVVVGTIAAVYTSGRQQIERIDVDLRALDEELRWELARARELELQSTRTLAQVLHGKVQARLSSAYLRVQLESVDGTLPDGVLEDIRTEVLAAIAEIGQDPGPPDPLEDVVRRVQATWAGLARVSFTAGPRVEQALARDPASLRVVNELIPELCFNAIKHAAADEIEIVVDKIDPRAVLVQVRNNGHADTPSGGTGLGSRMIEHSALWWRRDQTDGITTTSVCIPFAESPEKPSHSA